MSNYGCTCSFMDESTCIRPDHNRALTIVRCDRCGKDFSNRRKRCRCGHDVATYARAAVSPEGNGR